MANSFASLSAALAWGATIFALIVFVVGLTWMNIVVGRAEREARKVAETEAKKIAEMEARQEAKACAEAYIKKWLAEEAGNIVRRHVELLADATLGAGDDGKAADEIGENA
jgi:membrane protein involved in colicin uptake